MAVPKTTPMAASDPVAAALAHAALNALMPLHLTLTADGMLFIHLAGVT